MSRRTGAVGALRLMATLSAGVVYGTDVFFALVGSAALGDASETSLVDVMGRLHATADKRMPVVGVVGLLSAGACALGATEALDRRLAAGAFALQVAYLGVYGGFSKPINDRLVAAALRGSPLEDAHRLQRRWNRIVAVRSVLMLATMSSLALVSGAADERSS